MDQILSTTDLVARLRENPIGFVRQGYEQGLNVSRWLEEVSPSEKGDLSAFERVLEEMDIRTHSDPAGGYWASNAGEAFKPTDPVRRVLLTEFFARTWRNVAYGRSGQRDVYLSDDYAPGTALRPYVDAAARLSQDVQPAIPLSELVSITTAIQGTLYRSLYLTYDAEALRLFRVGESANIPIATITSSPRTIQLHKYGRGLRASYEALRQMTVDRLALHIGWMAVQSEVDKVAAVLNIIVNGDGNSGTAATNYNQSTLDSAATPGTLSIKAWLSFKKKWVNPYMITTALMQEAVATQLELLTMGTANVMLMTLDGNAITGSLRRINRTSDAVAYGWDAGAPSLTIVGWDNRISIEQVTEIGADIQEMAQNIENQTQVITMTETNGFAVIDANGTKTLSINA
jgi:hypothetical protein